MFKSLLKLLTVATFGMLGDPAHHWRLAICMLVGAVATVVLYWKWPGVLPMWPGALLLVGAGVVGAAWEWLASERGERTFP